MSETFESFPNNSTRLKSQSLFGISQMFLNCSHYSVLIPMFWDFSPWWDAWSLSICTIALTHTVFLDCYLNQWQANSSLACLPQRIHNGFRLMCFWLVSRSVRWASCLHPFSDITVSLGSEVICRQFKNNNFKLWIPHKSVMIAETLLLLSSHRKRI